MQNFTFPLLIIFSIYYVLSILIIACILFFVSSVRMRNIIRALITGSLVSILLSIIIMLQLNYFYSSSTLSDLLIFSVCNFGLQSIFLFKWYQLPIERFLIPLVIGNSLAFWVVFPTTLNLF